MKKVFCFKKFRSLQTICCKTQRRGLRYINKLHSFASVQFRRGCLPTTVVKPLRRYSPWVVETNDYEKFSPFLLE